MPCVLYGSHVDIQEISIQLKWCAMKVIIQCSGTKRPSPIHWQGRRVCFVADPTQFPSDSANIYTRPDDRIPGTAQTWRDMVVKQTDASLSDCCKAADLYKPPIYGELVHAFGYKNCYILSAGWGLIRGDFRLPEYDITFSAVAPAGKRRRKTDSYQDFNQLKSNNDDVTIFAGLSYLPLIGELMGDYPGQKTVYYKSENFSRQPGFLYRFFKTTRSTNWHYEAATAFVEEMLGDAQS
jgi:hypothetical protein